MTTLEQAALLLSKALDAHHCIVLSCHCSIVYSGRAESYLDPGDRIIIVKSDGALLIHQPQGSNPVNYMKPESSHSVSLHKGMLWMHTKHLPLKEYLDIAITKIHHIYTQPLEDTKAIVIRGTEKDMSAMIFKNPGLIEKGFKPLSQEEHTQYGFIDVFGYDQNNVLTVIECKRYTADPKAVDQLQRYVRKIKASKGVETVRGIIAAPRISPSAEHMLQELNFEFKAINPPNYLERFQKDQKSLVDFS